MSTDHYSFTVLAEDVAAESRTAESLADIMREIDGVLEVSRKKSNEHTMDLGAIVTILAGSGATLAIARGIASWLRARRAVTVHIERRKNSESLKAVVSGVDPQTAAQIIESVITSN